MNSQDVKFGEWIREGFDLYKDNTLTLILVSLIATVLSAITMGILAGPLLAGLVLVVLKISRDKKSEIDVIQVFDGFQFFLPFLLFLLALVAILAVLSAVLSLVFCAGVFVLPACSVALWSLLMFAPFLMVVALAIGSSGALVCGVGAFATAPIALCLIAVAYRELAIGDLPPVEAPVEEEPPAEEPIEVEVKAPVVDSALPAEEAPAAESESDGEEPKPQG